MIDAPARSFMLSRWRECLWCYALRFGRTPMSSPALATALLIVLLADQAQAGTWREVEGWVVAGWVGSSNGSMQKNAAMERVMAQK